MPTLSSDLLRDLATHAVKRADKTSECWIHPGSKNKDGYVELRSARLSDVPSRSVYAGAAHRIVYEYSVGPIPEGLTLHHTCYQRACINPAHLVPMTLAENLRDAFDKQSAAIVARNGCINGHSWNEHTFYVRKGTRYCRTCNLDAARRYNAKKSVA